MGRGGRAGPAAVAALQEPGHPAGVLRASAHLDQAAHDVANHVVQEAVRRDEEPEPVAPGDQSDRAHRAYGRASATGSGAEGGEVVLAAQQLEARAHRRSVQPPRQVPGVAPEERVGDCGPIDEVEIALPGGRTARVEAGGGRPRVDHPHGVGQERVERALQALGGEVPVGGEAGDLAEGVDPRVGTAGPGDRHGGSEDARARLHQQPLDGGAARLPLPAVEVGAVVRDGEPERRRAALPRPQRMSSSAIWTPLRAAPLRS